MSLTTEELKQLAQETFIMLKPSPGKGVGVFAIRDIPRGTRPFFPGVTSRRILRAQVDALPAAVQFLVRRFGVEEGDGLWIPADFRHVDLVFYLNSSEQPNIRSGDQSFEAMRDIAAGEELLIDYDELEHKAK